VNGDAESGTGSSDGSVVVSSIPGWTTTGEANVVQYGASGGYPASTDPGPSDRATNFFAGGPNDATSTFTQTIDLSAYATQIDSGAIGYLLSAYLGGYSTQDDNASLAITFFGAGDAGTALGTGSIGPVLAADRGSVTGLFSRTGTGSVPVGTRSVQVVLTMTRVEGTANDGYADDLSLRLTAP
jgi:hypothetical protein